MRATTPSGPRAGPEGRTGDEGPRLPGLRRRSMPARRVPHAPEPARAGAGHRRRRGDSVVRVTTAGTGSGATTSSEPSDTAAEHGHLPSICALGHLGASWSHRSCSAWTEVWGRPRRRGYRVSHWMADFRRPGEPHCGADQEGNGGRERAASLACTSPVLLWRSDWRDSWGCGIPSQRDWPHRWSLCCEGTVMPDVRVMPYASPSRPRPQTTLVSNLDLDPLLLFGRRGHPCTRSPVRLHTPPPELDRYSSRCRPIGRVTCQVG